MSSQFRNTGGKKHLLKVLKHKAINPLVASTEKSSSICFTCMLECKCQGLMMKI